ncbi:MAG TPA: hypothetical protein VND41_01895 [Nitrososphaerales archaeon]|nr:hypothetical protein [Nitrososphaerales archaeon]
MRKAVAIMVLAILVAASVAAGYLAVGTSSPPTTRQSSTISQSGATSSSTTTSLAFSREEESGPVSSYPAAWTNVCGRPPQGNLTTANNIMLDSIAPGNNLSLSQVYSRIVDSTAFRNQSAGKGWVTAYWLSEQSGSNAPLQWNVVAFFVLLSGGAPSGYLDAFYDLGTSAVTVNYESDLFASCPPGHPSSSTSAGLAGANPGYFAVGQPVEIELSIVDYAVANMTVASLDSCLGSFTILQGNTTTGPQVYDSTKHPGCSGAPVDLVLNPGQSYNETLFWNQTDDAGQQVPTGVYELMGVMVGSGSNVSMPWGVIHAGLPQSTLALNESVFGQHFSFAGYVLDGYVAPGNPFEISWNLNNNAGVYYELETSPCSYNYKILSLSNAVVFDSSKHLGCNPNQLLDNPLPEYGGVSQASYWNQTDDSGRQVAPGVYRAIIDLHVVNDGHVFTTTAESDFEISSSGGPPSWDQISVGYSSICASGCLGPAPGLYSVVDANGNYSSLRLYLNGTLLGTVSNPQPCCRLTYEYVFNVPLDNETTQIVHGVSYDIVVVGTFDDGNTTTSWTNVRGG